MPLILAGLLPLVSLGGVLTMPATEDHSASNATDPGTSIATDPVGEAPIGQQDDAGFEGTRLDAINVDGDDSGAPGKSEEAPGHPSTPGQGEGRGQEKADESGQGPINGRDNSSTRPN
jgi:hypothetical protein